MFTVRSLQQGLSTVIAVAEILRSKGGIFQEEHGRERAGAYVRVGRRSAVTTTYVGRFRVVRNTM